ncbi:hypothetical protein [Cohaesibacter gelatinilyticus]|uniref:Bacteriophage lambda head decoration protein D n=1 Tax=Cohaesibacter gelatinilyticus TaxID=372072 RepID=A0A285PJX8_9HYPH|nr:hypothetical protein [Cohaesibacter gelatinilyticus]SNZ21718.1 hypothetical protein SAMN06265368_4843 [Cohaesibacter gelatinilyticus]
MADLTITAASVVKGANAVLEAGTAGAAITAGQVVYRDSSYKYQLCDADSATADAKKIRGVALNGASDGQPLTILKSGKVTIGATLVAGTTYVLSDTAGGIAPQADLGSGDDVAILGAATSTSEINVAINNTGVTL